MSISLERERFCLNQLVNPPSDKSYIIVNNKRISIRMLRGPTLEGSFPFTNETLQTEGVFSFEVSQGREKPKPKKTYKQTNKQK